MEFAMYKALAPGCIGFNKSFKEAAGPMAKHGYEGFWFSIESDSQIDVSETRELLAQNNLCAAGFSLPVEFRKDDASYLRDMEKLPAYVRYAEAIGADRCATWIMPFSEVHTYEENFIIHKSRLKPIAELFNDHGILLGLEFVGSPNLRKMGKYRFINDLAGMLDLCHAIRTDNCGLLLDLWHWDMAGQTREDFSKIDKPDRIALVHINDAPADVKHEDQVDGVRTLPGETGVLKTEEFFNGLKSLGYKGPVMPEPFEKKLHSMSFDEALETVMTSINKVWPE